MKTLCSTVFGTSFLPSHRLKSSSLRIGGIVVAMTTFFISIITFWARVVSKSNKLLINDNLSKDFKFEIYIYQIKKNQRK
jgi:hypothetical protein